MRVTYRDPEAAADALDALIRKSGNDLRAAAQTLRQDGPEGLGALRGREGWLASEAAKTERTYARSAAWGNRLGREAQVAERERTRQEERQRQGLPPEPPREQQRKGLGLSR